MKLLTIKDIVKLYQTNAHTLRYYSRSKCKNPKLIPVERGIKNVKLFNELDVESLFVKRPSGGAE